MTRTYCDHCAKEVTNQDYTYSCVILKNVNRFDKGLQSDASPVTISVLCDDCAEYIKGVLSQVKAN